MTQNQHSTTKKKVLCIFYYWPPCGGVAVIRGLKFVKYLRYFGWEPVIYIPENPHYPVEDAAYLNEIPADLEVIKKKIWEPYEIYKNLTGMKKEEKVQHGFIKESGKQGFIHNLSVWIRGNYFIPDARKFWIRPSVRYLKNYLKTHSIDAMFSSGPPHSVHLIGLGIKKWYDIPWVADFRDPWTEIDFYHQLKLTRQADKKHRRLEKAVLTNADQVITVGWEIAKNLDSLGSRNTIVVPNGFDETDFQFSSVPDNSSFTITHVGSLNRDRNHPAFWKALAKKIQADPEFQKQVKIQLIGKVDYAVVEDIEAFGLREYIEMPGYMSHHDACMHMARASLLFLSLNNTPFAKGILTGKMFEYLAAKRPILCLGPRDGDATKILNQAGAGDCIDFEDTPGVLEVLNRQFEAFKSKTITIQSTDIDNFSRKKLTQKLAQILDRLTSSKGQMP